MLKKILLRITSSLILIFCLQTAIAQNRTVTGTITDAQGLGIPGVTVTVKGTNRATQTSTDGTYSIEAPENGTLVFFCCGIRYQGGKCKWYCFIHYIGNINYQFK